MKTSANHNNSSRVISATTVALVAALSASSFTRGLRSDNADVLDAKKPADSTATDSMSVSEYANISPVTKPLVSNFASAQSQNDSFAESLQKYRENTYTQK